MSSVLKSIIENMTLVLELPDISLVRGSEIINFVKERCFRVNLFWSIIMLTEYSYSFFLMKNSTSYLSKTKRDIQEILTRSFFYGPSVISNVVVNTHLLVRKFWEL